MYFWVGLGLDIQVSSHECQAHYNLVLHWQVIPYRKIPFPLPSPPCLPRIPFEFFLTYGPLTKITAHQRSLATQRPSTLDPPEEISLNHINFLYLVYYAFTFFNSS